jgi:hypothetical protein
LSSLALLIEQSYGFSEAQEVIKEVSDLHAQCKALDSEVQSLVANIETSKSFFFRLKQKNAHRQRLDSDPTTEEARKKVKGIIKVLKSIRQEMLVVVQTAL